MTNPIPARFVHDGDATDDVSVAFDAFEDGDARAMSMIVGMPATVGVGSDSYAGVVSSTTAKTITCDFGAIGRQMTFRCTKHGWTFRKHNYLAVGFARAYSDPSF